MNRTKEQKFNYIYTFLSFLFVLMILPKMIQMLFILMLFSIYLFKYKKIYISKDIVPFMLFGIIHLISIIVNMASNSDVSRIIAAFNTFSLWILGPLLYSYLKNEDIDKERIAKIMFRNSLLIIFFSLLFFVMLKINRGFELPILRRIATFDWAYGYKSYRFVSFMEYPNLIPIFYFISLPYAYKHIEQKNKVFKTLFLFLSVLPIVLCNSRLGIVLSLLCLIYLLPNVLSSNKKSKYILTSLFIIVYFSIFALNYDTVFNKLDTLINSRQDSNSMRYLIYKKSISATIEKNIFIGCGIKTMMNGYPLGSHSTFIGAFYKTGITGLIFLVYGFLLILKKVYIKDKFSFVRIDLISYLCLLAMLAFEDLDGSNWICIIFFILLAISLENKEEKKHEE